MKNSVQVFQLVDEFAEQFYGIMDVERDANESRVIWIFTNIHNGSQFAIIYDDSNSLHHREGIHTNLQTDIDHLNDLVDRAEREGFSTIYIHNQTSF